MTLPNWHATVNASLFAYKFDNLQDINLVSSGSVPTYNVTTSDQKAHGLDLDGRMRVNPHLTVFGGLEYLDQTYTSYTSVGTDGSVGQNLAGQAVGTPYLTAMGGVNVNWEALGGRTSLNFQGTFHSGERCNSDQSQGVCRLTTATLQVGQAGSKFDLRLGWDSPEQRYGVALIVNNVFDQRYITSLGGQTYQYGMPYAYLTPPRAIGVEFRASM